MKVSAMQIAADTCWAQMASSHPHPAAESPSLTMHNHQRIADLQGLQVPFPGSLILCVCEDANSVVLPSNNMHIRRSVTLPFGWGLMGWAPAPLRPAVQGRQWSQRSGWTAKSGNFKAIRWRRLSPAAFTMIWEPKSKIVQLETHWGKGWTTVWKTVCCRREDYIHYVRWRQWHKCEDLQWMQKHAKTTSNKVIVYKFF